MRNSIFCKETNIDIYLHWRSFAPITWKKGTLKTLTKQAYTVYSNDNLLQEELHNTEKRFTKFNGYPKWLFKQIFDSFTTNNNDN